MYTHLVFHCLFDIDYLHFYTWLLHLWWFFLNLQRLKNVRKIRGGYRCQPVEEWWHPYPNNGGTTVLMDQKSGKLTSWGWLVVENPHYLQGFEKKDIPGGCLLGISSINVVFWCISPIGDVSFDCFSLSWVRGSQMYPVGCRGKRSDIRDTLHFPK